jgi:hypothetical protein
MAAANNCIIAIFNIPDRGLIPFIIYPDKNEAHEIQLTPDKSVKQPESTLSD